MSNPRNFENLRFANSFPTPQKPLRAVTIGGNSFGLKPFDLGEKLNYKAECTWLTDNTLPYKKGTQVGIFLHRLPEKETTGAVSILIKCAFSISGSVFGKVTGATQKEITVPAGKKQYERILTEARFPAPHDLDCGSIVLFEVQRNGPEKAPGLIVASEFSYESVSLGGR